MKKMTGWMLGLLFVYAGAVQAAPGEFWELTTQMEGMGMAMPARTSKECVPNDEGKPAGVDKNCKITDLKRIPNGTSWKMSCQDGTSGSGTQTRIKDVITSDIFMNTSEGSMKLAMKGKRLGGSCDTEAKFKEALGKSCDSMLSGSGTEVMPAANMFLGKDAQCAQKKEQFCSMVKRDYAKDTKNFTSYANAGSNRKSIDAGCGINGEAGRKALCKFNADNRSELDFLKQFCPAEAKALKQKIRNEECSGRSFTAAGDKEKCLAGIASDSGSAASEHNDNSSAAAARGSSSGTSAPGRDAAPSGDTTGDAVDQGKKALKGLKDVLGF